MQLICVLLLYWYAMSSCIAKKKFTCDCQEYYPIWAKRSVFSHLKSLYKTTTTKTNKQTNKRSKIKTRQIQNTNENQVPGFRQAHLRCWATGMDYSHFCFSMGIYVVRSFVVLFLIACVIILYYGKKFKQCLSTQTIPNLYVTFNIVKFVKKIPLIQMHDHLICVCVCDWVFVCVFLVKKQNKAKQKTKTKQE